MRQHGFQEDQRLVVRCLECAPGAWEELQGYHPGLVRDARRFQRRRNIPGVAPEDIVQDTWLSLFGEDCRLLREYNPQYAPVRIYLRRLVRLRVRLLRCQAKRRISAVSLTNQDRADPGASDGIAEAAFHECQANLSPAERQLLAEEVRQRQQFEERSPVSQRLRQARHRLKAKLRAGLGLP